MYDSCPSLNVEGVDVSHSVELRRTATPKYISPILTLHFSFADHPSFYYVSVGMLKTRRWLRYIGLWSAHPLHAQGFNGYLTDLLWPPMPSDFPFLSFTTAAEFEGFLDSEYLTLPGFHLKLAKKASGIPSITLAEATEVVLCFGWIDGGGPGRLDDDWWAVTYRPRKAKSIWSQKNVNTVGRLTEEGKMRPAGMAAVGDAKADGRWDRAYAGPATITVADDLAAALAENKKAEVFFAGLNRSDRYAVLWRVETASAKARVNRIATLVEMLAEEKVPGRKDVMVKKGKGEKSTAKPKASGGVKKATTKSKPSAGVKKSHVQETPRRAGLRERK